MAGETESTFPNCKVFYRGLRGSHGDFCIRVIRVIRGKASNLSGRPRQKQISPKTPAESESERLLDFRFDRLLAFPGDKPASVTQFAFPYPPLAHFHRSGRWRSDFA